MSDCHKYEGLPGIFVDWRFTKPFRMKYSIVLFVGCELKRVRVIPFFVTVAFLSGVPTRGLCTGWGFVVVCIPENRFLDEEGQNCSF